MFGAYIAPSPLSLLTRIDAPETGARQFFGLQDAARNTPGDVNGDGVADIYVDAFLQSGSAGPAQGKAWVFDGKASSAAGHGVLLYEVKDPSPGAGTSFGFVASRTDYNKDGTLDLLVGGIGGVDHEVYITNGKDGSPLKTLGMPASDVQPNVLGNSGSELGTGSRALGDINGDGEPDYVAGAAYQDVGGNQDQGRLYFFLSNVPTSPPPQVTPPGALSAVTGAASKIGNRSATLGGLVLTGGQSTAFFFQYGTSRFYGSATGIGRVSTDGGVSAPVSNLSSATTYHFRLVAINSSGTSYGADRTFRTTGSRFNGRLILKGSRLRVKGGKVSVRFQCASTRTCTGKFSIGTRAKIAKTAKTGDDPVHEGLHDGLPDRRAQDQDGDRLGAGVVCVADQGGAGSSDQGQADLQAADSAGGGDPGRQAVPRLRI